MNGFWTGAGTAQQVVIAAASAWNALYFTRRATTGIAWLVSYRPRSSQDAHHSTHVTGGAR